MPSPVEKLLLSSLLFFLVTTCSSTNVGVTYDPTYPNLPPPDRVAATLHSLGVPIVRLLHPSPPAIEAFSGSGITLLLSIPNDLITSFAANRSDASKWLYSNVVPFYPRSQISMISVGDEVLSSPFDYYNDNDGDDYPDPPSMVLVPAMRHLRIALAEVGIRTIAVSTTFSFDEIVPMWFPPSSAKFQESVFNSVLAPLLDFLEEGNSSILVNVYPYNVYRLNTGIPMGYVMFQDGALNFRDDVVTGVRYRNVFDAMFSSIVAALENSGHRNIPLIVTGIGWPTSSIASSHVSSNAETEATEAYAELYLRGLTNHLKKEAMPTSEVYIYELFDGYGNLVDGDGSFHAEVVLQWGIMYPNMTMKFNVDF